MTNLYWGAAGDGVRGGAKVALRAMHAWDLLCRFGLIAGKSGGEDSAGRAKTVELSPEEAVDRAFAMADAFVAKAEARGEIREFTVDSHMKASVEYGRFERVRSRAAYPRSTAAEVEA